MRKAFAIAAENAVPRRVALRIGLAGLGAAAGIVALSRSGRAFTIQQADEATSAAFHSACGQTQYHDQLASEVRSILGVRNTPADAMPQNVTCPVCSCQVTLR